MIRRKRFPFGVRKRNMLMQTNQFLILNSPTLILDFVTQTYSVGAS